MDLVAFQLACMPVLFFAYAIRIASGPRLSRTFEIVGLIVAGYAAEQTCISLYGFYAYDEGWALRVGDVPLLVPLIWPMVVLSARELVRALAPAASRPRTALLVGLFVILDASLMEVVAVGAGYWTWSEPGYLGIPVIGILGWGFFAAAASWWLDARVRRKLLWLPLFAGLATHALLLASWWGALRFVLRDELPPVSQAAPLLLALGLAVWVWRAPGVAARPTLVARVPAALLFVAVLAFCANDGDTAQRYVHVAIVAVPYALLCARSFAWRLRVTRR